MKKGAHSKRIFYRLKGVGEKTSDTAKRGSALNKIWGEEGYSGKSEERKTNLSSAAYEKVKVPKGFHQRIGNREGAR